jgi:hypothetical protein
MFVGQWRFNRMYEGKLYEMQDGEDSKFDLYEVKYDAIKDRDIKLLPNDQAPISKKLISAGLKDVKCYN